MQQTSLLLDICDLPSLDSLSSEDGQQLEAIIDLCRTKERPDLAAPYAALLCKHLDLYRESECSLWFDAIAEDDIFLVKALVVAGIDINTSINIRPCCTIPKQDSSLSGADFAQLTCCRTGIPNPVILLIAFTHASASPTCAL